jgi:hypothetical protein
MNWAMTNSPSTRPTNMTDGLNVPAERDFPPGRLPGRKEHLVRELSAWDGAVRRRRRRLFLLLGPAAVVLLAVTGFTTYALTREPTHFESVGCFETADLEGNVAIVSADGRSPTAICTEVWQEGAMGARAAPNNLAACVLDTGAIGVFPSSGGRTCEQLGLADLPPTYAAERQRFAELRDVIVAHIGEPPTDTSPNTLTCVSETDARALIRRELDAHGYRDWGIEGPGDDYAGEHPCLQVAFDGEHRVIMLVPYE